jgi:A/G-specific adenine glycosylase
VQGRRPRGPEAPPGPALVPPARRAALRRRLLAWYGESRRDLPWRRGPVDPYRSWIAEVMLQQTRVEAAIPYYRRFLERFPSLPSLAEASEGEVLALWAGLGYYARGRNLLAAARAARERHGRLPASLEDLRRLPGFGPYTAGAVASIAFGIPVPAVDGNAARVLARLFLVEGRPEDRAVRERLGRLAAELVPARNPGDWNQALMELGATRCGRVPECRRCPLAIPCRARRAGLQLRVPPPRRRPAVRELSVACAAVLREGKLLLVRRPSAGLLGGLWELPSAPVEGGEPREALRRALGEVHGLAGRVGREVARVERVLTHRRLVLTAFDCRLAGPAPSRRGLRWVVPDRLDGLGLSTAMRRLAEAIPRRGGAGSPAP